MEGQVTRNGQKRKTVVISLLVTFNLIAIAAVITSEQTSSVGMENTARAYDISPEDTTKTVYGVYDTFDSADLTAYYDQWGYGRTVQVTSGELELKTYSSYSLLVRRWVNCSQGDFTFTFNFRMASDTLVTGKPWLLNFSSADWWYGIPLNYRGHWGIELRLLENYTLRIGADDGTLKGGLANPPTYALYYSTNKLRNGTNYLVELDFDRQSNTVDLTITNKSSSSEIHSGTYYTSYTSKNSTAQLPDRFSIGSTSVTNNMPFHWFYDNVTLSFTSGDHDGTELDTDALLDVVDVFGAELLGADDTPGQINLGRHLADDTPYGVLKADILPGSRDDVAGDMMSSLVALYEYTGETDYLDLAEDIWVLLETHQQADGGFTFTDANNDFSDTVARVMLGLVSLYRATGNDSYLDAVEDCAEALIGYQVTTGANTGMVQGHVTRPTYTYSVGHIKYFSAYFAVALLEAYKWIGDETYYEKAILALDYIIQTITVSGRPMSMGFDSYPDYSDYNDVVESGACLWALSEGYKLIGDPDYLLAANKTATYLLGAEFTKSSKSFGAWAGIVKTLYNQSDLVYNYMIPFGLKSYTDLIPGGDASDALNASLNFYAAIFGSAESVQGHTLNGAGAVWGGAWNFNNTADQGWTVGWWEEGGWGTWGEIGFYGWQANVIKVMTMSMTIDTVSVEYPNVRSMLKVNETGAYKGVFACSPDVANIGISTDTEIHILVSSWDTSGEVLAAWVTISSPNVEYSIFGVDSSLGYRVYQDGDVIATGTGPSFSFSATNGGEFQVEIWLARSVSTLVVLAVNLVGIGIFVALIGGFVMPTVRAIQHRKEIPTKVLMNDLMKAVVFIVVGLIMWRVLHEIAIG